MMKLELLYLVILTVVAVRCEFYLKPEHYNAIPALEMPHNKEVLQKLFPNYRSQGDRRISNGWPAYLGQFPYQALVIMNLGNLGMSYCGGTFVRYNWVLTAAHCLDGSVELEVYGGKVSRITTGHDFHTAIRSRSHWILHEQYNSQLLRNDIALIYMQNAPSNLFDLPNVAPIALPTRSDANIDLHGYFGTITGFGQINDFQQSYDLLYTTVNIIHNDICRAYYHDYIQPSNVCIDTVGGYSTCPGDSGGKKLNYHKKYFY